LIQEISNCLIHFLFIFYFVELFDVGSYNFRLFFQSKIPLKKDHLNFYYLEKISLYNFSKKQKNRLNILQNNCKYRNKLGYF